MSGRPGDLLGAEFCLLLMKPPLDLEDSGAVDDVEEAMGVPILQTNGARLLVFDGGG